MHLNKILDQIKHHPSPTEAIDKLGKALEKHEGSLLEKGFQILKSELCANVYEAINGPHFDEEHARYAVEGMENEDGTKGPHWTVEETTSVANQMGINLRSEKHNKWDLQNLPKLGFVTKTFQKVRCGIITFISCVMMKRMIIKLMNTNIIKESVLKYDEEMRRCEDILKLLNTTPDITTNVTKDFKELDELKAEVKELKQLLQNVTTVRPEVKIETPSSEEKQIEI